MSTKMKVIDLFCGAGGFSEGFSQAGFEIAMGIDIDKNACMTFEHNFSRAKVLQMDIKDWQPTEHHKVDIIIGSPPCIEFSKGNVNRTFDLSLVNEFLRIVKILNPKYWIMENVEEVRIMHEDLYRHVELPQEFKYQILKAEYFGVASRRPRFFGGIFPKVKFPMIKQAVKNVIKINVPGFRTFKTLDDRVFKARYIDIDGVGPCITTKRQHIERYLLPNGRQLEVGEMALLMGFPDDFLFLGSRSKAIWLIGNAVCPPVAKAIAEAIRKDQE